MVRHMISVLKDNRGVSALEYSILAGLVALGLVTVFANSGINAAVTGVLSRTAAALNGM